MQSRKFSLESDDESVFSYDVSSENLSEEVEDEGIEDSHENTRSADKKGIFYYQALIL